MRIRLSLSAALALVALTACRQDMHDQPRFEPLAETSFWPDGRAARPAIDNTVARGYLKTDARFYKGKDGDRFVTELPVAVDRALVERGRGRYNIFCSPCHGKVGDGEGMAVQRGFKHPPTFHQDRLRGEPVGYFYDVITNGYGAMASYASRIPPADRWAIVAYVRALQLSQNASVEDVPAEERQKLDSAPAVPPPPSEATR